MKSLAQVPQSGYTLVVLNGNEKGVIYQLSNGRITLGRGDDNTIVLKDDSKISRNHAVLLVGPQGVEIQDVSDRNTVFVNGEQITSAPLQPGNIIQMGTTKLQFKKSDAAAQAALNLSSNMSSMGDLDLDNFEPGERNNITRRPSSSSSPAPAPTSSKRQRNRRPQKSKLNFYMMVIIIGAFLIWILNTSVNKKAPVEIKGQDAISAAVNSNVTIAQNIEAQKQRDGVYSQLYKDAQQNFIKGFRDFRKGQYERAIESFSACLSLFPKHPQCEDYKFRAETKFDELVKYQLILGKKYQDQGQYDACMAAYRNVKVMVRDTTKPAYREAKAGLDACTALAEGKY